MGPKPKVVEEAPPEEAVSLPPFKRYLINLTRQSNFIFALNRNNQKCQKAAMVNSNMLIIPSTWVNGSYKKRPAKR